MPFVLSLSDMPLLLSTPNDYKRSIYYVLFHGLFKYYKGWSKSFDPSLVNKEYLYQTHKKVLIRLCHFVEKEKSYHLKKKTVRNTYIPC
jgi:hypothetical protein